MLLPGSNDARLHTALVIMTIHVLGQVTLGFAVSIPQIASAIAAAAVMEAVITAVRDQRLAWPASAVLTGSGVGLILRVNGTEPGDHWSRRGWYLFALVSTASLATKYLIRWRGSHLFNPSNVGLVAAFLLLGRSRVEPLDLWWSPLNPGMILAYAAILIGGVVITHRLQLLSMAISFWLSLVGGLAVLATTRHCLTSPTSLGPVCDWDFWWLFATSPEILVFLFFMLPDPRTVPASGDSRMVFGVAVGAVATALIAPAQTEFAAKVGLLGALTLVCAARPLVTWISTLATERLASPSPQTSDGRSTARLTQVAGVMVPLSVALGLVVVIQLGTRAREPHLPQVEDPSLPDLSALADDLSVPSLPQLSFDSEIEGLAGDLTTPRKQREIATALLFDLAAEAEILKRRDANLLPAVVTGDRLAELERAIEQEADGRGIEVTTYEFERLHLVVGQRGGQGGALLGVTANGQAHTTIFAADNHVTSSREDPVEVTFVLIPADTSRWLILDRY